MEKINKQANIRFLSIQVKQALFFALQEARKNKTDIVTLKFIFYGLIKTQPSLLVKIINKFYKKTNISTLLTRCKKAFKNEYANNQLNGNFSKVTLSKSARNLVYDAIRSTKPNLAFKNKSEKYVVITTVILFKGLMKNSSFKNWLLNEILFIKH